MLLKSGEDVDMTKNNIDDMVEDLLYIHEDIKEVLDVDSEITQMFLHKTKYKKGEVEKLHARLFLDYTKHMLNEIDKSLSKFRLASIKHFKETLARPKDTYQHLARVQKPDKEEVEAASSIYETVLESRLKLKETFNELIKEEKDKFRNRFYTVAGIVALIYTATATILPVDVTTKVIIVIYLILGLMIVYSWLKNSFYKIELF